MNRKPKDAHRKRSVNEDGEARKLLRTENGVNLSWRRAVLFTVHCICLAAYALPIATHPYYGGAVLDEGHIVTPENRDVAGTAPLIEVFRNDYWGRHMNSESSHKSWRPLSILSFRWLKGAKWMNISEVTMHRLVNVLCNAATAELLSIVAEKMFSEAYTDDLGKLVLKCLVKLLFALHPTHVEVTANGANRPHLLAVLCAAALCDPSIHLAAVFLVQVTGLLCSETFVFQMPAVCVTMVWISWRSCAQKDSASWKGFSTAVVSALPRVGLLFILSCGYVLIRHSFDWLSIPEGLIRPAENPFFLLKGAHRARNYMYVLSIHLFKSVQLDFVGFSHEYGRDCIREIHKWSDPRMGVPFSVLFLLLWSLKKSYKSARDLVVWLWYCAWLATLFPVSGFVKVGTFVSDRICVGASVPYAILFGHTLSSWIVQRPATRNGIGRSTRRISFSATVAAALLITIMWYRAYKRSFEWMDWNPLMESQLRSCPRSAKANLEVSKLFSGMDPSQTNLTRAEWHLKKAESIDPTYCDVHWQMAQVHFQRREYLDSEVRMAKALLCPFTMKQAMELWGRYWKQVADSPDAQERLRKLQLRINRAIEVESELAKEGRPQWMGGVLGDDDI